MSSLHAVAVAVILRNWHLVGGDVRGFGDSVVFPKNQLRQPLCMATSSGLLYDGMIILREFAHFLV